MGSLSRPAVLKVIARSLPIGREAGVLRDDESVLADNRIAGATVDFPIAGTCQPSRVCLRGCYAASNTMAIPANIAKQWRRQHAMEADPVAFADRVAREYDAKRLTFLRWNGVGDLTPAAVVAINHLVHTRPDITLWVVTRVPELAAGIAHGARVYLHVSLDRASMDRRARFLAARTAHTSANANYFWSYQGAHGEVPPADTGASVIFHRGYRPAPGSDLADPATCPLNVLDDAAGACNACRRCFNGEAVRMRLEAESRGAAAPTPPPGYNGARGAPPHPPPAHTTLGEPTTMPRTRIPNTTGPNGTVPATPDTDTGAGTPGPQEGAAGPPAPALDPPAPEAHPHHQGPDTTTPDTPHPDTPHPDTQHPDTPEEDPAFPPTRAKHTAPADALRAVTFGETRPLGVLRLAEYNPRVMAPEMMDRLMTSIRQYGFMEPVVIRPEDNLVIGGHQRVEALRRILLSNGVTAAGVAEAIIPVAVLPRGVSDVAAKAANVALNRVTGQWSTQKLNEVLSEVYEAATAGLLDFTSTGFVPADLDDLAKQLATIHYVPGGYGVEAGAKGRGGPIVSPKGSPPNISPAGAADPDAALREYLRGDPAEGGEDPEGHAGSASDTPEGVARAGGSIPESLRACGYDAETVFGVLHAASEHGGVGCSLVVEFPPEVERLAVHARECTRMLTERLGCTAAEAVYGALLSMLTAHGLTAPEVPAPAPAPAPIAAPAHAPTPAPAGEAATGTDTPGV